MADESRLTVASDVDLVLARKKGRELAIELGFSWTEATLIATAISELARNILSYAGDGEIVLSVIHEGGLDGVEVMAVDSGPGIVDVEAAMQEGFSTSGGLGMGLPGARRLMDEFQVVSEAGKGTTVAMRKWRREEVEPPLLDWGMATWTLPGQTESGDVAVVASFPNGALAAAVDGLGHGPEAARAARVAARVLEEFAGDPVDRLVKRSHEALRGTRGVVMSVARFDARDGTVAWLGVGNVETLLVPAAAGKGPSSYPMILRPGIVGYRLPPLEPTHVSVRRGDTLVFATDGIRSGFAQTGQLNGPPVGLAHRILATSNSGTDDALVLVTRYMGERRGVQPVAG